MSICCCSLAGTAACRYCSNNPCAELPPTVCTFETTTEIPRDYPFFKLREEKHKTNADKIRSMTDEELATIIFCGNPCVEQSFNSESELLDWLKQEATE